MAEEFEREPSSEIPNLNQVTLVFEFGVRGFDLESWLTQYQLVSDVASRLGEDFECKLHNRKGGGVIVTFSLGERTFIVCGRLLLKWMMDRCGTLRS